MDAADLLRYAVERGASDLHLSSGNVPFIRVDGELLPTAFPVLQVAEVVDAAQSLMLRQDPDVIFVGAIRDAASVASPIQAARKG